MRKLAFLSVIAGSLAASSIVAAVPDGTTILSFEVPVAPFAHTAPSFVCFSERTISIVSDPTSAAVKVVDANDPMRWSARADARSLVVTTRHGFSGKMKITHRDRDTLRAIADEGVSESFTLDYRSGRAIFTTLRNLPTADSELLGRTHYMRCTPRSGQ